MQSFWSAFESKEHQILLLWATISFPFALGWLWNPVAVAVLCPPSQESWRVFVCPPNWEVQGIPGGSAHGDSFALQPGELNLCFGTQTTLAGRCPSSQLSRDAGWPGITLGSKVFFWKRTSAWGVSARHPSARQPLLSNQVLIPQFRHVPQQAELQRVSFPLRVEGECETCPCPSGVFSRRLLEKDRECVKC